MEFYSVESAWKLYIGLATREDKGALGRAEEYKKEIQVPAEIARLTADEWKREFVAVWAMMPKPLLA